MLARELLANSGSVFVQISDHNLHHVRELLDEVFGDQNFVSVVSYTTTGGFESSTLSRAGDYLLWYCRNKEQIKYRSLFQRKRSPFEDRRSKYDQVELPDGTRRALTLDEKRGDEEIPTGSKIFRVDNIVSQGASENTVREYYYAGQRFPCGENNHFKASVPQGMDRLGAAKRLFITEKGKLGYVRFFDDFPYIGVTNIWDDIGGAVQSRSDRKIYVVQSGTSLIERCLLMTTDAGDLVLDPTCGSGTTAYCAEQWGRRWLTIDTSRVPLALARQRLLTATYPWYKLKDETRGPAAGFIYLRKQNKKGEEAGGIVPHVTLESIANDEPPKQEVLADHPEPDSKITRVTGPFCVEATIPTPRDWEETSTSSDLRGYASDGSFVDRMIEILRKTPILRLEGNRTVILKSVRPPAKSLSLSAEAVVANGAEKPVAFVFGPENGAVSEKLVYEAAREARAKSYTHLYVVGFAIQPNARQLIEKCDSVVNISATYVQATPDLMMSDLLKNTRSSQVFSVCGMPEAELRRVKSADKNGSTKYEVELLGMDVFDPTTLDVHHRNGEDVPAWFLDTDYNSLCFHASQAFFPRTGAWENLKKALRGDYEESVWDHLAGTVSAPFEIGEHGQIAVKVIDDRGNELLIVMSVSEAKK
jgi:adenine-specific DNA-methyltransferase